MNASFTFYSTDQLVRAIAPALPPQVQQVADQLGNQTGQVLTDFGYSSLLVACLSAAIVLLLSSLLLVLNYPRRNRLVQPTLRLIRSAPTNRQPKRPIENRVATANRAELRLVSARIRAGQLSN